MLYEEKLSADLCVVGGGYAGLAAAVSAARQGIKTVLIHERPVLGGNASSEVRMWVCGAQGKNNRETGITEEIMLENLYRNPTKNYYIWDTVLWDFAKRESNLTLLLNATCMDAETTEGTFADGRTKRIKSVKAYQMTTQTFYTVSALFFADCSGDSVLAPLTGALYSYGREAAGEYGEKTHVKERDAMVMGSSCLIQGRETASAVSFKAPSFAYPLTDKDVENRPMDILDSSENFWYLELGGTENTIKDAEKTKDKLIPLAVGAWDYLKNSGKYPAENWELDFLGFLPAKRESRRMTGEYTVTQTDIAEGKIFPDTVAFGGWPLDDHEPLGYFFKGAPNVAPPTPSPYTLPYRALYSKNVENLFFAGRNISMTHAAMSSTRVMATCSLLGQAVGVAASLAVEKHLTPHGVYLSALPLLQEKLMESDCFLPHFKRQISPLCQSSSLPASLHNGEDRANRIYGTENASVPAENGKGFVYTLKEPQYVSAVHIVFDSDLNRDTLPGDDCERNHGTRANTRLCSPVFSMPKTLCRSFTLSVRTKEGEKVLLRVDDNRRRCYHAAVEEDVLAISLVPHSNWGGTEQTPVISFDFR
ncbi:MAG: FAD-dependent oxidoreductase [Clostridia bacterium]|nr:FAD-dependent oxidoreductase [Clostridia bacterium]